MPEPIATEPAPRRDPGASPSLPEMLRIMDVATALRKDRELVDLQLGIEEVKARLRDRLIEAAKVTGEDVTPAEVDAAVERYYQQLHTFREPPMGVAVALAHVYVRRWPIARWGLAILGAWLLAWWLFLSPEGRLSPAGRERRRLARLGAEVASREESVRLLATSPPAAEALDRLRREAAASSGRGDAGGLAAAADALAALEDRLREEYAVTVVASPRSGIDRYYTDEAGKRLSGYYLIVQAKAPDGRLLTRRVLDAETRREADVTTWAERVPQAVYDRLAADKRADGILDETLYAVKRPGTTEEEVVMKGPDGAPLRRLGQITRW